MNVEPKGSNNILALDQQQGAGPTDYPTPEITNEFVKEALKKLGPFNYENNYPYEWKAAVEL